LRLVDISRRTDVGDFAIARLAGFGEGLMEAVESMRRSRSLLVSVLVVTLTVLVGSVVVVGAVGSRVRPLGAPAVRLTARDLLMAAATAQGGIFLEFDGVTGPPSTVHTSHAPLLSVQFGTKRPVAIGAGTRSIGKSSVSDITVTKTTDKYSAGLMKASLIGNGSGNAVIYFTNVNVSGIVVQYLEYDLQHVLVSSFSMSSGGEVPTESITLNFTQMTMKATLPGNTLQQVSYNVLTAKGS
jgi:type VI secretion system secreted protein Hcp